MKNLACVNTLEREIALIHEMEEEEYQAFKIAMNKTMNEFRGGYFKHIHRWYEEVTPCQ